MKFTNQWYRAYCRMESKAKSKWYANTSASKVAKFRDMRAMEKDFSFCPYCGEELGQEQVCYFCAEEGEEYEDYLKRI